MKQKLLLALGELSDASPLLSDGTLWTHAATMGTRIKGTAFTIDKAVIDNFVQVFKSGYPQKICVDYEHGTVNGAADSGQPVPAAGQIVELKGVYSVSDFTDDLKATAEKLAAKVNRKLDDPRNFGLWMRWRPTARAAQMVTSREYTEVSIAFSSDYPDNETGEAQGPTILSVALTNTPFLDDMLPVAASRDTDRGTSTDLDEKRNRSMPVPQMLQRAAALFGRAFTNEDEVVSAAEERINSLSRDNTAMKPKATAFDAVVAVIGESDPTKVAEKVRSLKTDVDTAKKEKDDAADKAATSEAEKIMLKHETRLTPAQRDYFKPQLIVELKAGAKSGETKVEKVIESFPENKSLGRRSASDGGKDAPTDRDSRVLLRAEQLKEERGDLKAEVAKGGQAAWNAHLKALRLAGNEIPREETKK
jgi:phage I-like protein